MWGSIPGPQDHDVNARQTLNRLSHTGGPYLKSLEAVLVKIGHGKTQIRINPVFQAHMIWDEIPYIQNLISLHNKDASR